MGKYYVEVTWEIYTFNEWHSSPYSPDYCVVTVSDHDEIKEAEAIDGFTAMYRMYNPNSGEHFYTASLAEANQLASAGWNYEDVAWYAPTEGEPVYRMYNPNSGDHHYTTSALEKNMLSGAGWSYEGIGWYSGGDTALLRLYNPNASTGSHHYTTSANEKASLEAAGWQYEGIGWYGK